METNIIRKPTSFRLRNDLLESLKAAAAATNRSLNNYVETVLSEAMKMPNDETKSAIEEARSGKHAGTIDMSDFNSFMKSINDIK
jgi:hypothetical protein